MLFLGGNDLQILRVSPRDSSNESGATDAVGLSMNMSEIDDTEIRGKKKRGRPGKQALVSAIWNFLFFFSNTCLIIRIDSYSICSCARNCLPRFF